MRNLLVRFLEGGMVATPSCYSTIRRSPPMGNALTCSMGACCAVNGNTEQVPSKDGHEDFPQQEGRQATQETDPSQEERAEQAQASDPGDRTQANQLSGQHAAPGERREAGHWRCAHDSPESGCGLQNQPEAAPMVLWQPSP